MVATPGSSTRASSILLLNVLFRLASRRLCWPTIAPQVLRHWSRDFINFTHAHLGNPGKGRQRKESSCPGLPRASDQSDGPAEAGAAYTVEESIIESTAKVDDVGTGYAFRNYYYAMAMAKLAKKCVLENICLDTGCSVSLADRA